MSILLKDKVLFFDDACILCNKCIRLIHFLDVHKTLFFSPLQSPLGIEIQRKSNLKELDSTAIYHKNGKLYTQSSAIIHCLSDSYWLLKPVLIFLIIPSYLRNKIYELIARNRKRIFKNQTCSLPSESLRKQIIDSRH